MHGGYGISCFNTAASIVQYAPSVDYSLHSVLPLALDSQEMFVLLLVLYAQAIWVALLLTKVLCKQCISCGVAHVIVVIVLCAVKGCIDWPRPPHGIACAAYQACKHTPTLVGGV